MKEEAHNLLLCQALMGLGEGRARKRSQGELIDMTAAEEEGCEA